MKKILIVKAYSRFGLKFLPYGGVEFDIGVEEGSNAVLSEPFLEKFPEIAEKNILSFTFPDPEAIASERYYAMIAEETNGLAHAVNGALSTGEYGHVITVGGDHSIALGSTLGNLRHLRGKKVGLIIFDSHADIHLVKTSPSGNFHGMWLRPILGDFDNGTIKDIVDVSLDPSDLLYIGNMHTEEEEDRFIAAHAVQKINSRDIENDAQAVRSAITQFCEKYDYLHVSFDIDVFNQSLVSATGTPNPEGLDQAMVDTCLQSVLDSKKVFSFDLVEVNPEKEGAEKTVEMAQKVLEKVLISFR